MLWFCASFYNEETVFFSPKIFTFKGANRSVQTNSESLMMRIFRSNEPWRTDKVSQMVLMDVNPLQWRHAFINLNAQAVISGNPLHLMLSSLQVHIQTF